MDFAKEFFKEVTPIVEAYPRLQLTRPEVFGELLAYCHAYMVASEDLLTNAAYRVSQHRPYFLDHLQEEAGHATWLMADIKALREQPKALALDTHASIVIGTQFYLVKYVDPAALLGYMALMEGFPIDQDSVDVLKVLYPDSMHTLAYHAKHDVEHRLGLITELEKVENNHELIIWNGMQCARVYKAGLESLVARTEKNNG